MGIIGIVFILGLCFLLSNNKKNINYRTVCVGLILQFLIAFFVSLHLSSSSYLLHHSSLCNSKR